MIAALTVHIPGVEISGPLAWFAVLALLPAYLYSLVWVYYDAKRRRRGPWAPVAFIALGGWPLSLLWWTLLRPDYVNAEKFADLGEQAGAANRSQPISPEAERAPGAAGSGG